MDLINLRSLKLTAEESKGLIKFLAKKRGITTKKLLSTIKLNLKRKNNKDLVSKSQQKLIKSIKSQHKLAKTQLELIKSQQKLIKSIKTQQKLTKQAKSQRELIKSQRKLKKQQTLSNTRKIRNSLYNNKLDNNTSVDFIENKLDKKINNTNDDFIENIRDLFSNKLDNNTNVDFIENKLDKKINNNTNDDFIKNKLDKKINNNTNDDDFIENIRDLFSNKLDKKINNNNNTNDDFIENVRDLFSILDYEPILIITGFDNNNDNNYNYLEYMSNGNNSLSFDEYLELIKPYLNDLINVYKAKGEWKLQLSAGISFVSQKPGSDETHIMYSRSIPEEIMSGSETEEIMEKLIKSLLQKYQDNLQNKMKGSDFMFNGVNYLFYDLNRITISKGGSYIESPKWHKDKKCTINQKNTDNKCFQYATTLALNFNNIDKHHQRI